MELKGRSQQGVRRVKRLVGHARDWLIGSDPGPLRLQAAARTTVTVGVALLLLWLLSDLTGQPLSAALVGVLVAGVAGTALNVPTPEAEAHHAAAGAGRGRARARVLLAPHPIAADTGFVAIVGTATYARRFGSPGGLLGRAAIMAYFARRSCSARRRERCHGWPARSWSERPAPSCC